MSFIKSAALVIATLVLTSAPAFAGKARQTKAPVKAPAYEAPTAKFEYSPKPISGSFSIQSGRLGTLCVEADIANFGKTAEAAYVKMKPCKDVPGQRFAFGDNNMIILSSLVNGEYMALDVDFTNYGINPLSDGIKLLKAFNRPEQQVVLKPVSGGYQFIMGVGKTTFSVDADVTKIGVIPNSDRLKIQSGTSTVNPERTWKLIPR